MVTIYFSGTGNTKYIADSFSKKMNINCYSIEDNINFKDLINNEDTICFCYPIYGSYIPRIMREFVLKYKEYLNGKKIIILITQNVFSGDGSRIFKSLLKNINYTVIYAKHFNMPNNICNVFFYKVNNKNINKYIIKNEIIMNKVVGDINNNRIYKQGFNIFSHMLGLLQRPMFKLGENKLKKSIHISNKCNLCKLCVKVCPTKNLYLKNNKIHTNNNCTLCYRCINKCPQKAIYLMFKKVNEQYKGINNN